MNRSYGRDEDHEDPKERHIHEPGHVRWHTKIFEKLGDTARRDYGAQAAVVDASNFELGPRIYPDLDVDDDDDEEVEAAVATPVPESLDGMSL